MSTRSGIIFGAVMAGLGIWLILFGLRLIEPGGRLHVPHWALIPMGLVFGGVGCFIWFNTWRQQRAERRREEMLRLHPDEPAFAEYNWNPEGAPCSLRAQAIRSTCFAIFFILFLTPINWIVLQQNAPVMMRVIIAIFDLVTVALIWICALRWCRVLKFGDAFLRFERFPLRTREPVRLTWISPEGCRGQATGSFTLRSIVEWYETSGRGKSKNTTLVREQQWASSWRFDTPAEIMAGEHIDLVFNLPPDALGTSFFSEKPIFWELEVVIRLPGVDFKDLYLVPIYAKPSSE